MRMLLIGLLAVAAIGFLSAEPHLKEIRYHELVNHGLFDDHGNPSVSWFDPFKANTIFQWTGEIVSMSTEDKEYIRGILKDDDFASIFNHYMEIVEKVDVDWSDTKVDRFVRLYLQDPLMEYLEDELTEDDYLDVYYWLVPPFSSFNQRVNCFMVWYYKVS